MPFTGSHPAAVLPLLRTPLVASALVIGSMAPDAPLFRLSPASYGDTHSALGIVTTDVALGIVFYLVWHILIVPPAAALAPRAVRGRLPLLDRRFAGLSTASARWLGLVAISIAIGAATHVGWDEFTHPGRWGAHHIGVLAASFHGIEGCKWAQYLSDVLGGGAILGYLAVWWRRAARRPVPPTPHAALSAVCALGVGAVIAVTGAIAAIPALTETGGANLHRSAFVALTHGGAVGAVAVILIAVGWHLRRAYRTAADRRR